VKQPESSVYSEEESETFSLPARRGLIKTADLACATMATGQR
jgi:hypothetical protein